MAPARLAHSDEGPRGGTPFFLLHGSPTDRHVWDGQVGDLVSAGLRVVRPDLRGHGESPLGDGPSTVEAMADDVLALADDLGIPRFLLGGFSFGGWVSMEIVRAHPERVLGLLLVSTGARPDTPKEKAGRGQQAAQLRGEGIRVDGYRDRVLTQDTLRNRPEVWQAARNSMAAVSAEGRARAVEGMGSRSDFRPVLKGVRIPALVVAGAEDPVTPPELAREIHGLIPGSFLQVVEGASHFVTLEAPGIVSQAISNWLRFSALID